VNRFELERFDITENYENEFLRKAKEEHLHRYAAARDFLSRLAAQPLNILDAACGNGYGYQYLASLGTYVGVDLSDVALEAARKMHPDAIYRQGDLSSRSTLESAGDLNVIVSFETIEHMRDPDSFCRNCYDALKKTNGYFVFSAPTVLTRDFDPFHLHDRSAAGWRETAKRGGFTILEEEPLGFQVAFQAFARSAPHNPEQQGVIIRFLLTHPRYLLARFWEWIVCRKFVWGNQVYFCQAR
jgi:2-polyprenyl-3-methyl-5-hydroxy-6-metoxy-1,4-benzoquinol methylase